MENFAVFNPTCLYFGKGIISGLAAAVSGFGQKVLLVSGKGSIKTNGIYDDIIMQLKSCHATWYEYTGVKPNPEITDVSGIADLGRREKVDVILAVGGGSVIDAAKIASLCIPEPYDPWDVMKYKVQPKRAIPLIAVLSLAGTGTEMNNFAVSQNPATREKIGYGSPLIFPRYSFLDPCYTYSVNAKYTAFGIVDLIAHVLEAWFGYGDARLSDRFAASIILDTTENAPKVLSQPNDYDARANMMWQATCALNGLPSHGRKSPDWGVHDIGHTLSFLYDLPHGATLSIAYPAWMKLQIENAAGRISQLGRAHFNVSSPTQTIEKLEDFFKSISCPVRLNETGVDIEKKNEIVSLMRTNKVSGLHHKLSDKDYEPLVEHMFQG